MASPVDVPGPGADPTQVAAMRAWRSADPTATFAEIEATRQVAALRRDLIQAALTGDAPPAAAPPCPDCDRPMARNGSRTRAIMTSGGERVMLTGPRYRCSACGVELFPPR
ncbi:MAG: hypothetical protein H0V12_00150 [Chloroflexi bacterium]|nr:hypothetical protein [Chloroflexota bacterium]